MTFESSPPEVPPPGYGQAPGYYPPPPDHPQATVVLVLGILSLMFCQLLGPVAWVMGRRARDEIDQSRGAMGGRGMVMAGYVCGIVATVLLVLTVVVVAFALAIMLVAGSTPN
ncbi:DUF4190 domain-containing protein [Nocardia yamanashiensis]|uniref:DUF4190 domain-containing protein n=1 Tax=Nocardia yamanashiensis TaxID=209247 RepID=UPI000835496D|nr:DUF4190 domain-containing protein [Nocardia yamanashiensis]